MHASTSLDALRRRRLTVIGAVIAFLLLAFVTCAALVHRSATTSNAAPTPKDSRSQPLVGQPPTHADLSSLPTTSDPEAFSRSVAEALFAWDTATMTGRAQHVDRLVAVADPTGESTPGLVADLDNYLPNQAAWTQLAGYETRQWLTVDSVRTPTQWAVAEAQAGDDLLPGTTAYTIHGTRHRAGVWKGSPVTSQHDVAFTLFIVCGPSYPECHLLRLSMLDKPLD
jgi:hypothetical protein